MTHFKICILVGSLLTVTAMSSTAVALNPSEGCEELTAPVSAGQLSSMTIYNKELLGNRTYALYLPAAYVPQHPTALVIGLHGWTGTGSGALRGSGSDKSADRFGYITAWPDGINWPDAGRGWAFPGCNASPPAHVEEDLFGRRPVCDRGNEYSCTGSPSCPSSIANLLCLESGQEFRGYSSDPNSDLCVFDADTGSGVNFVESTKCNMNDGGNCNWCGCSDDELFIREVVADIAAKACVDLDRVYLTGNSQGGMMTSWMYSKAGDVFAAFAPQSGTNPRDFYANPRSPDSNASVMFVHGTNDSTVPHDGNPASDGYRYEAVWDEVLRMSGYALGGCPTNWQSWPEWPIPDSVNASNNVNLECRQPECAGRQSDDAREFVYCTFNGGHIWPKSAGRKESSLWGNRLMWEFFVSHCNEDNNECSTAYVPPGGDDGGGGQNPPKPGKGCNPKKDPDCDK
jgi:poly(3-hydroxybutyrate) depolymerase